MDIQENIAKSNEEKNLDRNRNTIPKVMENFSNQESWQEKTPSQSGILAGENSVIYENGKTELKKSESAMSVNYII
jgi:hypothetical protein